MEAHEKMEVRTLVACVLRHFDRFKVSDGEEDLLDVSRGAMTDGELHQRIIEVVNSTGEDVIRVFLGVDERGKLKRIGMLRLIYGNGPGELVADGTDTPAMEAFWADWQKQTDQLELIWNGEVS